MLAAAAKRQALEAEQHSPKYSIGRGNSNSSKFNISVSEPTPITSGFLIRKSVILAHTQFQKRIFQRIPHPSFTKIINSKMYRQLLLKGQSLGLLATLIILLRQQKFRVLRVEMNLQSTIMKLRY